MNGFPDQSAATRGVVDRPTNEHRRRPLGASIGLTGVFDFRDLATAQPSGGPLRPGLLYRSDGINRCRAGEAQIIADLGVRRVLDLRTDRERHTDGIFEHRDIVTVHVPMIRNLEGLADRLDEVGDDLMPEFYLGLAAANSGAIALCIAEIIASASDDEPLIVHGTSGKDRTGIVAGLALALAGVDDRLIAADYARSAAAIPLLDEWSRERHGAERADELISAGFEARHRAQLLGASPATMLGFLRGIRRHYGSVEDYLVWGGTDRAELDRVRTALC